MFACPRAAEAQTLKAPAEALRTLRDGNRRFVARKLTFYREDLAILQQDTEEKQEPFASILSCADSRVPVELVFDQSIGHIFVTRIAGNIVTSEIIASLEYGAAVLGTKVILVMGHAGRPTVAIELSEEERETVRRWTRRQSSSQALALRSRIVLACADGGPNIAVAAFTALDGAPHAVPTWYEYKGGAAVFHTDTKAYKYKCLAHEPRMTLVVDTRKPPYKCVILKGSARIGVKKADAWARCVSNA